MKPPTLQTIGTSSGGATVSGASLSLEERIARLERLVLGAAGLAHSNQNTRIVNAARAFVCAHFKITLEDLDSPRRTADLCRARFIAYYLAREHSNLSYAAIGKHFANRDHCTVFNGCRVIETDAGVDPNFRTELTAIVNAFRAAL